MNRRKLSSPDLPILIRRRSVNAAGAGADRPAYFMGQAHAMAAAACRSAAPLNRDQPVSQRPLVQLLADLRERFSDAGPQLLGSALELDWEPEALAGDEWAAELVRRCVQQGRLEQLDQLLGSGQTVLMS